MSSLFLQLLRKMASHLQLSKMAIQLSALTSDLTEQEKLPDVSVMMILPDLTEVQERKFIMYASQIMMLQFLISMLRSKSRKLQIHSANSLQRII